MGISNFDMKEIIEMCKSYGASVKEGSGRITLSEKEFDVKELFENILPASVTSVSLSSSSTNYGNCQINVSSKSFNTKLFSSEASSLYAA